MKSLAFLIKPVSGLCNMRCKYCFYEDVSDHREQKHMGIMETATAEKIISEAFRVVSPGGVISFMFQGGEPTLAGLDFFREFVSLAGKYTKSNVHCQYAIQTNGFCLTEEWATFFHEHKFLVGLSIDGTQAIHDTFRVDTVGQGTWKKATSALRLLEQFHVETNILCVVTSQVAKKPQQVYHTLRQLGDHPLQFIPCLDPIDSPRGCKLYSLKPDAYAKFLCNLFDCWYHDWQAGNYTSIRTFDDYLCILLRMPTSACATSGSCGSYLVVEGNGGLYPCDFYVLDQWYLGNIRDCSVEDALSSAKSKQFIQESLKRPVECLSCRYMPICRGGCRRDWMENGSNYYCQSYHAFFQYSIARLEEIAAAYLRNFRNSN